MPKLSTDCYTSFCFWVAKLNKTKKKLKKFSHAIFHNFAHYFILIIHCGGLYLDKITSVSQEISNQLFITAEQKNFSKQTKTSKYMSSILFCISDYHQDLSKGMSEIRVTVNPAESFESLDSLDDKPKHKRTDSKSKKDRRRK